MKFLKARVGLTELIRTPRDNGILDHYEPSSFSDLSDYLDFDFDSDNELRIQAGSYKVELSATYRRCSFIRNKKARIYLDLQPAYDVAGLLELYSSSRVWPALIASNIVSILSEILYAVDKLEAGAFVDGFIEKRLRVLINESSLQNPMPSWRWGSFDVAALEKQLVAFQTFHEIGHLTIHREKNQPAKVKQSSIKLIEDEEVLCDKFAWRELWQYCCQEDTGGCFWRAPVACFLCVIIWLIGERVEKLDDNTVRAQLFAGAIERARLVSLFAHNYFLNSSNRNRDKVRAEAQQYVPIFQDVLRILDICFLEGCAQSQDLFRRTNKNRKVKQEALNRVDRVPSVLGPPSDRFTWEHIWVDESERAYARYLSRTKGIEENLFEGPRSRMMFS